MPISLPPLSRRRFLAGSLAAGASLLLRRPLFGEEPQAADPHHFALLSDTHVAADPALVHKDVTMAANLKQVCGELLGPGKRPTAALVNGDLAMTSGLAGDYATFLGLLKPVREGGM